MHSKTGLDVESRFTATAHHIEKTLREAESSGTEEEREEETQCNFIESRFLFHRLVSGMLSNLDPTTQKLTTTNQTHKWSPWSQVLTKKDLHTLSFLFLKQQWHLRSSSQAYSDVRFSM